MELAKNSLLLFLARLPQNVRLRLLESPVVASAILRLLPAQCKALVFSLFLNDVPVGRANTMIARDLASGLLPLIELGVVREDEGYYAMSEGVRRVVLSAYEMYRTDELFRESGPAEAEAEEDCYYDVLHKIINRDRVTKEIEIIHRLMVYSGLISAEGITHLGFGFLLLGRKEQIWYFIVAYLQMLINQSGGADGSEFVGTVVAVAEITLKRPSKTYSFARGSVKRDVLDLLASLGVVKVGAGEDVLYFRAAFKFLFHNYVTSGRSLILESNFKLYAYTTSQLDMFITSLFARIAKKFPNLVASTIDEESVRHAFDKGITSGQIIEYMVGNSIGSVDANVLEQIRMWESRKERIQARESYAYSNFLNYNDFEKVLLFCRENGIPARSYGERRLVIVDVDRHEEVKKFIRARIK